MNEKIAVGTIVEDTAPIKDGTVRIKKHTILFVCTGNTCRSPMCAALFNEKYSGLTSYAVSAGLFADGSAISDNAVLALEQYGIKSTEFNNYKAHVSRNVTARAMEEADTVIGVTKSHAMELTFRFPAFATKIMPMPLEISDPYGGSLSDYEKCLSDIDAALEILFSGGTAPSSGE